MGEGPVEAVAEVDLTDPTLKEKVAGLSDFVVAGSDVGFANPREKLGTGSVSEEALVSEAFGNPLKEKAGLPDDKDVVAAERGAAQLVPRPEPNVGKVTAGVDTEAFVLSPKLPKVGAGRVESFFSSLTPPVKLKVTVLFLVEAPSVVCVASAVDVGEDILPTENEVDVVDVTDVSVAEVCSVAVFSFSVVLLLSSNANPPLLES